MWQDIVAGFDAGNETINFGTRICAESDNCVYEVATLAKIRPEEEIIDVSDVPPKICLSNLSRGICLSIDSNLAVFKDDSCTQIAFNYAFDSKVEALCPTPDGKFLFLVLNNGTLLCMHVPTDGEVACKIKLTELGNTKNEHFNNIVVKDIGSSCFVYVVSTSGTIVRLEDFDFEALDSAFLSEGYSEELVQKVQPKVFQSKISFSPIQSVSDLIVDQQVKLLAVGEGIGVWTESDGWSEIHDPGEKLVKVEAYAAKQLFVALNSNGQLFIVCPYTLMMHALQPMANPESPSRFVDFIINGSQRSEPHIIGITKHTDGDQFHLMIIDMKDVKQKLCLPLREPAILFPSREQMEDILFVVRDKNASSQIIESVTIKAAVETNPNIRYERLLTRRRFTQAQELARNFGLDMNLLHMGLAKDVIEKMSPWNRRSADDLNVSLNSLYEQLIEKLDNISDMEFVCHCCVNAIIPDYQITHRLLVYAKEKLQIFLENNPHDEFKVTELSDLICSKLLRLETFDMIETVFDLQQWLNFSNANLLEEVQSRLIKGKVQEAGLIWIIHKPRINFAGKSALENLLEVLPEWIDLDAVLLWMKCLLPPLLELQSDILPDIIEWIKPKIRNLERTHFKQWPQIGLEYLDEVIELIASQKVDSAFVGYESSPLRPLVALRSALRDIQTLRTEYFIGFSLQEYIDDDFQSVAVLLLDRIDLKLLPKMISSFLNRYILDHKLDLDGIIVQYVQFVLGFSTGWWCAEIAPWEERVAVLISYIKNYEKRFHCISAALEEAPIPWSDTISRVAEDGLKLKHPLASKIREKQKQLSSNLILKKYNMKTSFSKIDKTQFLKYIIRQNRPGMLDDVEIVSHNFENKENFYLLFLQHLVYEGHFSEVSQVLQRIPLQLLSRLSVRIIRLAGLAIPKDVEKFRELLIILKHFLEITDKNLNRLDVDNGESILLVQNKWRLKEKYGLDITISESYSLFARRKIFRFVVEDIIVNEDTAVCKEGESEKLYCKIVSLSELLQLPSCWCLIELTSSLLKSGSFQLAARVASKLIDTPDHYAHLAKSLCKLAILFIGSAKDIDDAATYRECASITNHLVCEAYVKGSRDEQCLALQVLDWAATWNSTSGHREITAKSQCADVSQWRFNPLYQDLGLAGFLGDMKLRDLLWTVFNCVNSPQGSNTDYSAIRTLVSKLQSDQHDTAVFAILSLLLHSIYSGKDKPHVFSANGDDKSLVKFSSSDEELLSSSISLCNSSLQVLLAKIVNAKKLDLSLGLAVLLDSDIESGLDWLKSSLENAHFSVQKKEALAHLGLASCELSRNEDKSDYFKKQALTLKWGCKLTEYGIPPKDLMCNQLESALVEKVITAKGINIDTLHSFCEDYSLNFQDVLLQYFENFILSWVPDNYIEDNREGSKEMLARKSQDQLYKNCHKIICAIGNPVSVCRVLRDLWQKINFYHHEVFVVILDLLENLGIELPNSTTKKVVLLFLKNYVRTKSPAQEEELFWMEMFPSSYSLPTIAKYRLPFSPQLIESPLEVVRPEISLQTYQTWLSVADALNLTRDKICTIAVHESVKEELSNCAIDSESWCSSARNENLFSAVAKCVAMMDDVEYAGAALFFFTNNTRPGKDQVNAAALCVQYTNEITLINGNLVHAERVKNKYFTLATTQILHEKGLDKPNYLELINKPEELVKELYNDNNIVKWCRGEVAYCADINGAVEDIATLREICLKTLHYSLIMDWLQPDNLSCSFEDNSFTAVNGVESYQTSSSSFTLHDDDNLLRARYVMECGDTNKWAYFLWSLVKKDEGSVYLRLRSLQSLLMLADRETIEEITYQPIDLVKELCLSLKFVRELELLGITYSEDSFVSCRKEELANLLVHTQRGKRRAMSVLIRLCITYDLQQLSLWSDALQYLVDKAMAKELKNILPCLSNRPFLWTLPSFEKAWSLFFITPFSRAIAPPSEAQIAEMLYVMEVLPTCPVKQCLALDDAIKHCIRIGEPGLAALLLPYINEPLKIQMKEEILAKQPLSALEIDIDRLCAKGLFRKSKVFAILSA